MNYTDKITTEDIHHAEEVEMDIHTIMKLVDLIFLCRDEHEDIPS